MPMRDLAEFFDPTLRLPIKGKTYVIDPSAETGIKVQRLFSTAIAASAGAEISAEDLAALDLDDDEERDIYPLVLGGAYQEMLDDGLPWVWIKHAGTTALMWIGLGMEAAEKFWAEAPQGEARRPEPQDRKAPAKKSPGTRSRRPAASPGTSKTPPDPLENPSTS